ncbi:MAG: type II toxin-antitoxin system HicB family antitoxin [Clostridiales bacterium]|mgnify:CR=1 FL=1|jgi:antitoxin HicB|nr:type II toxin-antitoxin system HicB family antitoxin [Clostridiales bacterium]
MAQYCFPAVFTPEDGAYNVTFPDLPNCFTFGDTLAEAVYMAEDALALMLTTMEDDKQPIPAPTSLPDIACDNDSFPSLIAADTAAYRRRTGNRAVKKTLTIPQWLNDVAERQNVNFSQTLQDALMEKLDVS